MIGVRFYEVFKDRQKLESTGKAVAVFPYVWREGSGGQGLLFGAIVGLGHRPNAPALRSFVSAKYLQTYCRRIGESRARQIHPNLFRKLEGR